MKIIRLTTFLNFGGIESKMANLSTHSDDNEWIFCALGKGGTAEEKILQNKKEVVCFNVSHKIPTLKTIVKLYFYFKKQKPQVVHCAGSEANFHGVIAAKLAKVPVIIAEEIGVPSHSKLAILIFNFIYKQSNFVIGESQSVVDNLESNYVISQNKLKIIPNFALFYTAQKVISNLENDRFKIVSISRLETVKNIEGILNAVHKLKQNNFKIKYTIVGEGSLRTALENKVKQLNLENETEFVGFKENTENYYLNSDLYVLNSFSEGFSNSLLEAMYLKKMCVTTNVGAASQMIKNNYNGWITAVNDDECLYQKIKKCIELNSETRANIENNAHKTVIENFSMESHVNKLMQLYIQKK